MVLVGTGSVPVAVADGGKLVIVGSSNRFDTDQSKAQVLDVLSADHLQVVSHIQVGAFPREMRLSPDGNMLFSYKLFLRFAANNRPETRDPVARFARTILN